MAYTPSWIYDSDCAPSRDEIARPSTELQLYDHNGGLEGVAAEDAFAAAYDACSEDAVGRTAAVEDEERTRNGEEGHSRLTAEETRASLRLHYERRSTDMANGEIDPLEAPSGTIARFSYYDTNPYHSLGGRHDLQENRQRVRQATGLNGPNFEIDQRLLELRNGQPQPEVPPHDNADGHGTRYKQRKDASRLKGNVEAGAGVSAGRRFVAWVFSKLRMPRRVSRSRVGKPFSLDDDEQDDDDGKGDAGGQAGR